MADLEDRNRHNNLHLTGLQEGVQGADTVDFLTIVVPNPDWDGHSNNVGSPYLRYSDPQAILQAARKETSRSATKELKLFLDYSNFTAQRHKAFPQSITFARSRGLLTCLIYLAALRSITTLRFTYSSPQMTLKPSWILSVSRNHLRPLVFLPLLLVRCNLMRLKSLAMLCDASVLADHPTGPQILSLGRNLLTTWEHLLLLSDCHY
ncbi:hypothetical protein EOD39_13980 [Acipenser ruthenus]|uniref:Uncharacterized protein n=1 Tax=Acipenser ruthenus TaxID=7906 RepID=A0A662YPP8_ACIRT|nr:hypothetical protein EOD39_13980 [Acipenser ruthenus]